MLRTLSGCWSLILAGFLAATSGARADDIADDYKIACEAARREGYAGAVKILDAIIARHPELAEASQARGLASRLQPPSPLAAVYLVRAEIRLAQGEWERSLADCAQAVRLRTDNPNLLRIRGYAALGRRDLDLAIADLTKAIDQHLDELFCTMGRAVAGILARQYDAALADLDHVWEATKDPMVVQFRGAVRMCLRDHDRALADWTEAIRLDPRNPEGWINRSGALVLVKRDAEALADAETALRLDPKRALAWMNRGSVAIRQGRHDRAIADFDEAIRLDPTSAGLALHCRAAARWRLKDAAGALADLDRVAEMDRTPRTDLMRAAILATTMDDSVRDGARALILATRAVEETSRQSPLPLQALAAAQAELGRYAAAIESAEAALRLPPSDPIEWRITTLGGQKMSLVFYFPSNDPAETRRNLDQDLACYRAGKPNRQQ